MKQVTRIHTCVLHVGVMNWLIKEAQAEGGVQCGAIEFMKMPPPERFVSSRTVVPAYPLPDGSILTKIEVTELEDDEPELQWKNNQSDK